MEQATASASPRNLSAKTPDVESHDDDQMTRRETLELVRAYYKISDPTVRKRLFELAKSLASATDGEITR